MDVKTTGRVVGEGMRWRGLTLREDQDARLEAVKAASGLSKSAQVRLALDVLWALQSDDSDENARAVYRARAMLPLLRPSATQPAPGDWRPIGSVEAPRQQAETMLQDKQEGNS